MTNQQYIIAVLVVIVIIVAAYFGYKYWQKHKSGFCGENQQHPHSVHHPHPHAAHHPCPCRCRLQDAPMPCVCAPGCDCRRRGICK